MLRTRTSPIRATGPRVHLTINAEVIRISPLHAAQLASRRAQIGFHNGAYANRASTNKKTQHLDDGARGGRLSVRSGTRCRGGYQPGLTPADAAAGVPGSCCSGDFTTVTAPSVSLTLPSSGSPSNSTSRKGCGPP